MVSDELRLSVAGATLMLSVFLSGAAIASPPAASPPPPAVPPASQPVPSPEDSLFEFLGADDVGDTRWWDYLRQSPPPRAPVPPPVPAQEAKQ